VTRAQLEHAIRAACGVAEDSELWIFGSQAILGQFPEAPEALRESAECDVTPKNRPEAVDKIDGALGELSQFHQTYGFYVHGLSLEAATLPDGWKDRTNKIQNSNTKQYAGHCVEAHDLAVSKLVAFRDKDREFVRILLNENLIQADTLVGRIESLPSSPEERARLTEWIKRTVED
jgi:hypothetical protein